MKWTNRALALIFFTTAVYLSAQIIHHSFDNQKFKMDHAELNSIQYGLLSIEAWNEQITRILVTEINKADLLKANKKELRNFIESSLRLLIDEIYQRIKEHEGKFRQALLDFFVDLEEVKKGIPEYADAIMAEVGKKKNKNKIEKILIKKVKQYSERTFSEQDKSEIQRILRETKTPDIETAKAWLTTEISKNEARIRIETTLLLVMCIALFTIIGFSKSPLTPWKYGLLIAALLLLLAPGVTTPMIDLEAKISHLRFILIGHPIEFENQVLYFQTKSILDVFWILIHNKDLMMKFIGVLVITFSIFFPLLKIFSTAVYYFDFRHWRRNPLVQFFVLKSGKWSMADVMVVAIFMAYIGFNGIITNQFEELTQARQQVDMLTTNGTSLQSGYYLFVAYCLLGLFLSEFITRKKLP